MVSAGSEHCFMTGNKTLLLEFLILPENDSLSFYTPGSKIVQDGENY